MKTSLLLKLLLSTLLLQASLFAVEIARDNFSNGSFDGWSGGNNFSNSNDGWMYFLDGTTSKTYNFGHENAGKSVSVSYKLYIPYTNYSGYNNKSVELFKNNLSLKSYPEGDYYKTDSVTTTLDSTGKLKLSFNQYNPYYYAAGIDFISIQSTSLQAAAIDDSYSTNINTTLNANALDNDIGTGITATQVQTMPSHGTLTWSSNGNFSYTPDTGYLGSDFFEYTITDNNGNTSTAKVNITVTPPYSETTGGRPFTLKHQESLFGDVKMIGNSVLCYKGRGTTCIEPPRNYENGDLSLSKTSESYSTLSLPSNSTVKYARLYWQGRNPSRASWTNSDKVNAKTLKLKQGNNSFVTLKADVLDLVNPTRSTYATYSASADVTGYVQTHGAGKYYIDPDSLFTTTGHPDGLGAYGAWVLVVIYANANTTTAKNITIFDGYQVIDGSNSVDIPVSGFLTPKTGTVDSKAYIFVGEGDKYITGDDLLMKGKYFHTSFTSIAPNSRNAFNSRIDVPGARRPNLTNNNGIDIQKYNVGTSGKNIISTNETGATFRFTTGGDVYFPSLVVFSTELYLPKLCYDYSIRQDGAFLPVDRSAYPVAQLDGQISSSKLEVEVYLKNQEADIAAEGIALKMDINDTVFNHTDHIFTSTTNGSTLIDRGAPTVTNPLCDYNKNGNNSFTNSGCTTGHDFRKGLGALDAQEYIYTKFYLEPQNITGITDLNQSLGLSLKYYITAGGNPVEYPDYVLGSKNVPLCPPTAGYQPEWGQFNVVQSGQTTNNIDTQISRKPFNVDVIYDGTPNTGDHQPPSGNINTTVLVEMIDLDSFGDINASCANPNAAVSSPVFVGLHFDHNTYQVQVPAQNPDYFNFATKNTAYRIWYFDDSNGTLIQDWSATTSDTQRLNLTKINGLYDANTHKLCSSQCSDSTSTACFQCIRANYAKPLCSRDNFSVRPESYKVQLFDINQTASAALKDATKSNLTDFYKYSPKFATPLSSMQLTTGYNYRFDIYATGHNSTLQVPGYTRYFNGASDYNATLKWNSSSTACNDTKDRNIAFYVNNGIMTNEERSQDQVGAYLLNLQDRSWTAVDWDPTRLAHHTSANNFLTTADCQPNSSLTSGSKNGCLITSNHGTDGASPANTYRNLNLTFHPYSYSITNTITLGNKDIAPLSSKPYVYMADIDQNENVSVHFNTILSAISYKGTTLSNYVNGCYAEPLNITLKKSDTNSSTITYKIHHHDLNASSSIVAGLDINKSISNANINNDIAFTIPATYFQKDGNGSTTMRTNMNYNRVKNVAQNPEDINFTYYGVDNNTSLFSANLVNNKQAKGSLGFNQRVLHYYGRVIVPKITVTCASNTCRTGNHASNTNNIKENVSFVVYCDNATAASGCSRNPATGNLPDGATQVGDIRWWQNRNHDKANSSGAFLPFESDGAIGALDASLAGGAVTEISRNVTQNNYTSELILEYTGPLPFDTNLKLNSSNWLIYNPNNAAASANDFIIEWRGSGGWSGKYEDDSTTTTNSSSNTNRRTMW